LKFAEEDDENVNDEIEEYSEENASFEN